MVAPSGNAEKNLNMGAQQHTISYIKPQNFFLIARLNTGSVIINGDTNMSFCIFGITLRT